MPAEINIVTETLTSLGVGSKLSIAFNDTPEPIASFLIGLKINNYIIITIPDGLTRIRAKLFKENKIIIRYLYKGQIIAFASEIIDYITMPDHLIFINYPNKLTQKNIRETKRVECLIPAKTVLGGIEFNLVVTDISIKGCGLKVDVSGKPENIDIKKNQKLKIRSIYLSGKGEVEFSGIVKNHKHREDKLFVGLQFKDLNQDVQNYIKSYNELISNFSA